MQSIQQEKHASFEGRCYARIRAGKSLERHIAQSVVTNHDETTVIDDCEEGDVIYVDECGTPIATTFTPRPSSNSVYEEHEIFPALEAAQLQKNAEAEEDGDDEDEEGSEAVNRAKRRSIKNMKVDRKMKTALRKWKNLMNDRLDLKEDIVRNHACYLKKKEIECPSHIKPTLNSNLDDSLSDVESDDGRRMDWKMINEWVRAQPEFNTVDVVYGGPEAKRLRYGNE